MMALAACGPESSRTVGGGAGADPGNHAPLPSEVSRQGGVNPILPLRTAQPYP